ncbi:MAG: SpoIIIAH-like family protein [Bacillota bacterium]|jgi:stage III sporulation protein AH|nr:SpoIIIAH-like family protein [Bacillota bacterium]
MIMLRRKVVWLMILMIWVGMVTSIIVYQGNDYIQPVTSDNPAITGGVEIIEDGIVTSRNIGRQEVNYTQARNEAEEDFFIEYRLERDRARSEQINILREIVNNPNSDEASKKEAQRKILEITDKMEKEMEIESLIRARGYREALAYIHEEAVDVIIHTNGLERGDVAKIGDIIVKVTGFNTENVTIIEKRLESRN